MASVKAVSVVLVSDNEHIIPTCTTIASIIDNKAPDTSYTVTVIANRLTAENRGQLASMATETVILDVVAVSRECPVVADASGGDAASHLSLLKFEIPLLLSDRDRVLHLEAGALVRGDLAQVFGTDIGDCLAGVVSDDGQAYAAGSFRPKGNHFHTGMMLLNLQRMRELKVSETLKAVWQGFRSQYPAGETETFNAVLGGQVMYLPVAYGLLGSCMLRRLGEYLDYSLEDISDCGATRYASLDDLERNAVVINFVSDNEPWKRADAPMAEEWHQYYSRSPFGDRRLVLATSTPKVSVIIPVYNVEQYLEETLESVLAQTLKEIEIVCIDDGSTDGSAAILERYVLLDQRIRSFHQCNSGLSAARNRGMNEACGEYVYFLDSDDHIEWNALELLYAEAATGDLDVVYFAGDAFFDSPEMETQHAAYRTYYRTQGEYADITEGRRLFVDLVSNKDYRPSACLQFIRREYLHEIGLTFCDGIVHEDNLFTLQCIMQARRVKQLGVTLFHRRVRQGSIMTSSPGLENARGYLVCAAEMIDFVRSLPFGVAELDAAYSQIAILHTNAVNVLAQLPQSDRAKIEWPAGSTAGMLYRFALSQANAQGRMRKQHGDLAAELDKAKRRLAASEAKIAKLKRSRSYRIGRAVTLVPRRMRAVVHGRPHGKSTDSQQGVPPSGLASPEQVTRASSRRSAAPAKDPLVSAAPLAGSVVQKQAPLWKRWLKAVLPTSISYLDRKFARLDGRMDQERRRVALMSDQIKTQSALIESANTEIISGMRSLHKSVSAMAEERAAIVDAVRVAACERIAELDDRAIKIESGLRQTFLESIGHQEAMIALATLRFESTASGAAETLALAKDLNEQLSEVRIGLGNTAELAVRADGLLVDQKRVSDEILWAEVLGSTMAGSEWLHDQSLSPGRWAVGYPYLYVLYRVLNEMRPQGILDLGAGQSTRMIAQYVRSHHAAKHVVVEHDEEWLSFFGRSIELSDRTEVLRLPIDVMSFMDDDEVTHYQGFSQSLEGRKFDLISIDGPFGGQAKKYSRIDTIGILPDCLEKSFVILIDDFDRRPEQNTVQLVKKRLDEELISYSVGVYSGQKKVCVIASEDQKFLCTM